MLSLSEIIERALHLEPGPPADDWLPGYKPKSTLAVPGEGKLVLPSDPAGFAVVKTAAAKSSKLDANALATARGSILTNAELVVPMTRPDDTRLQELGLDVAAFRRENPRAVGLATALRLSGQLWFGTCKLIVLEHGIRFGSTAIIEFDDRWEDNPEEFALSILELCRGSASHFAPVPSVKARPWRTVTVLLGGSRKSPDLPSDWTRIFQFAGGLYGINLNIRPSPDSARAAVINDLQSNPPAALLVWNGWVSGPESYVQPFLNARRGAYVGQLGALNGRATFEECLYELILHLSEISSRGEQPDIVVRYTWKDAVPDIIALAADHFVITERATAHLENCTYQNPRRMVVFLRKLEAVARAYSSRDGMLGKSLTQYAMDEVGIEIALTDKGLNPPPVRIDGRDTNLFAVPHVKVDDYKSPDKCGRIYFAIDAAGRRFVVDHIGVHDYG